MTGILQVNLQLAVILLVHTVSDCHGGHEGTMEHVTQLTTVGPMTPLTTAKGSVTVVSSAVEGNLSTEKSLKCKDDWTEFQNSCYFFSPKDDVVNWFRAEANCFEKFGHLAIVNSTEENNFIKEKSKEQNRNYWIDGLDVHGNEKWKWASIKKDITGWTDWVVDKPQTEQETPVPMCAYMSRKNAKWTAGNCNLYGYYVCEKKLSLDIA